MKLPQEVKKGIQACLPTVLGYLSVSFAAGVLETTSGMTVLEIALLSIFLYAGSGQFIVAAMFAVTSPPIAIIFTVFFVNLRHLLLSSSVATHFTGLNPRQSFLVGALLTDETFGLAINHSIQKDPIDFKWMLSVNLAAYSSWFTGNVLGGVFGQWIPSPQKFGLDFAISAMFISILTMQLMSNQRLRRDFIVITVSACAMLFCIAIGFSYFSIVLATIIGATCGMAVESWA